MVIAERKPDNFKKKNNLFRTANLEILFFLNELVVKVTSFMTLICVFNYLLRIKPLHLLTCFNHPTVMNENYSIHLNE